MQFSVILRFVNEVQKAIRMDDGEFPALYYILLRSQLTKGAGSNL